MRTRRKSAAQCGGASNDTLIEAQEDWREMARELHFRVAETRKRADY